MINILVFILSYEINLFGLFTMMFGVKNTKKIVENKLTVVLLSVISIVSVFLIYFLKIWWVGLTIVNIIGFIVVVYDWCRRFKYKDFYKILIKGSSFIILEIILSVFIYKYYYDRIELVYTSLSDFEIMSISVFIILRISLIQCIITYLLETITIKDKSRKMLLIILLFNMLIALYSTEESIFLYKSEEYIIVEILYIISEMFNYMILYIVLLKLEKSNAENNTKYNTYEYYSYMEQEHMEIRKLYHDMKNQLMIMGRIDSVNKDNMDSYINDSNEKLDKLHSFYNTGNQVLDMLLFNAGKKAADKNIIFDVAISEDCLNFMKDDDVYTLFSNIINNAIEECEKIEDSERNISIRAGENKNDIILYAKNTVSKGHKRGSLKTTKKNKKMHGIGLTSIQNIADKYKGYISIQDENDSFLLTILFVKDEG